MIDISQFTVLISAFRVETEKYAIKSVECKTCLTIAEREQIMQYGLRQVSRDRHLAFFTKERLQLQ